MMTRYAAEVGNIDIGMFVMEFLHVAEENGLVMPTGVSMLGRGILTIEGVLSRVSPKTNLMNILAVHVSDTVLHEKNLKEELLRGSRALYAFGKRTLDLPGQASDLLRLAVKGQARIGVELVGSEMPLARFDRIMNRLIVGIVNAAAVIGSSILCTTDMEPKLLGIPLLGVLGFTASFVTTVWLIVRILRRQPQAGVRGRSANALSSSHKQGSPLRLAESLSLSITYRHTSRSRCPTDRSALWRAAPPFWVPSV